MNGTAPVFDKPMWSLLPDPVGKRKYANVSNSLEIASGSGSPYFVHLAVPADMFTFMRQVLQLGAEEPVTLAIDVVDDGRAVFSMLVRRSTGDWSIYDLWAWPSIRGVPGWMLDRKYRRDA